MAVPRASPPVVYSLCVSVATIPAAGASLSCCLAGLLCPASANFSRSFQNSAATAPTRKHKTSILSPFFPIFGMVLFHYTPIHIFNSVLPGLFLTLPAVECVAALSVQHVVPLLLPLDPPPSATRDFFLIPSVPPCSFFLRHIRRHFGFSFTTLPQILLCSLIIPYTSLFVCLANMSTLICDSQSIL